ncbi:MAG: hypothetical protein ACRDJW_17600 [Thermomicrobiales bacterium]
MKRRTNGEQERRGKPAGIPLGRALIIRPGIANDDLREMVAVASRVHGDGELPTIPMLLSGSFTTVRGRPVDGFFRVVEAVDQSIAPASIHLRSEAHNLQFVALHEIGHILDASGLPGTGYSSEADPALAGWQRAVVRSRAYRELEALALSRDPAVSGRAAVLLPNVELWARSYAQFVIVRGGNEPLGASLDVFRRREPDDLSFPRQWDDDDYWAIESEIDELFRRLGWIA